MMKLRDLIRYIWFLIMVSGIDLVVALATHGRPDHTTNVINAMGITILWAVREEPAA